MKNTDIEIIYTYFWNISLVFNILTLQNKRNDPATYDSSGQWR